MGSTKRAIAAAAFALVTFGAHAGADTALSQSGTIGKYNVIDSATNPGVHCSPALEIGPTGVRIDIPGPKAWAVDDSAGLDQQQVGWRWIVRYRVGGEWHTLARSTIMKATANDAEPYLFGSGFIKVSSGSPKYIVRETIFWYSQFGITTGKVTREVEYYRQGSGPGEAVLGPNGYCEPFNT